MPSIQTTDLAAVSTESKLYIYYQDNTNILEASSENGSSWTVSSTVVGDGCKNEGSAITAYYVKCDGSYSGKSTIHVMYTDAQRLREKVKVLPGDSWTENSIPDEIASQPIPTSRLSSGVCHDKSPGAHQWAFFEQINSTTGRVEVAEIRSGSESSFKWVFRKIMVQDPAATLPGTSLATNLTDPTTLLTFQTHSGDIVQYAGGYEEWSSSSTIIEKSKVMISTPLVSCSSPTAGKPHTFYVSVPGSEGALMIQDYLSGTSTPVAKFYPGTRLGAANFSGKTYLFYKSLTAPGSISTILLDGGSWGGSSPIVT